MSANNTKKRPVGRRAETRHRSKTPGEQNAVPQKIRGPELEDRLEILLDCIEQLPGCTNTELRQHSGLSRKIFKHGIRTLTNQELVLQFKAHGREYLFPKVPGVENWWLQLVTFRHPQLLDLYNELCTRDVWQFTDILEYMEHIGQWVRSTTQRRLRRLENAGLIESFQKTTDMRTRYYQTIPPATEVTKILTEKDYPDAGIYDGRVH